MAQLMRTSNPAFRGAFGPEDLTLGERMTVSGTVNKTGILTICVVATAAWTWSRFLNAGDPDAAMSSVAPLLVLGGLGGFVVALVTIFKKEWAPVTAPLYALLEGLVLGGISAITDQQLAAGVMWVPGSIAYTIAFVIGFYRWLEPDSGARQSRPALTT